MLGTIKRKLSTLKTIIDHEHYDLLLHKLLLSRSNALPFRDRYNYIVVSSHSTGLSSLLSYIIDSTTAGLGPLFPPSTNTMGGGGGRFPGGSSDTTQAGDRGKGNWLCNLVYKLIFGKDEMLVSPSDVIWLDYPRVYPFIVYKCDALIIDRNFILPRHKDTRILLSRLKKKVPIVWLVRDPIEIIKSYVNLHVLRSSPISPGDVERVIEDYINNETDCLIDFEDIYSQVKHLQTKLMIIDTKDISGPENTRRTVESVMKYLGMGKYPVVIDDACGNYISRMFPIKFEITGLERYMNPAPKRPVSAHVFAGICARMKRMEHEDDCDFHFRLKNKDLASCTFVKRKILLDRILKVSSGDSKCYNVHLAAVGKNRALLQECVRRDPSLYVQIEERVSDHVKMMNSLVDGALKDMISPDFLVDFVLGRPDLSHTLYHKIRLQTVSLRRFASSVCDSWSHTHRFMRMYERGLSETR